MPHGDHAFDCIMAEEYKFGFQKKRRDERQQIARLGTK
jgi:hypothetical protein